MLRAFVHGVSAVNGWHTYHTFRTNIAAAAALFVDLVISRSLARRRFFFFFLTYPTWINACFDMPGLAADNLTCRVLKELPLFHFIVIDTGK